MEEAAQHSDQVDGCNGSDHDQRSTTVAAYIGVRKRKWGKWVSEIREPGKKTRIWLGSYEEAEMAAAAYDVAALHLKGTSAHLNFPELAGRLPKPASNKAEDVRLAAQEAAMAMRQRPVMRRALDDQRVGLSRAQIQAINDSPLDSPSNCDRLWMDMNDPSPFYSYERPQETDASIDYCYYSIWD
ncbi:hypothetical protein OROGR_027617 [Orobanche gracilis]